MRIIIFDTDILSMFAKAKALDVLFNLLKNFKLCITSRIKEELSAPLEYGYSFPQQIFDKFEVVVPTKEEHSEYENLEVLYPFLGKGELEAISIVKIRKCVFATNDSKAFEIALEQKTDVVNVHTILKALLERKILNKADLRNFIEKLELADNTKIKDVERIFE
ncbi:MAG: hypothetical protein A2Y97_00615 [Nitrospirae bacterium RBG_13_39_12]|jgi:hypothetical protein|nr:MAG: hypothetical protein A2Y97_00615 [Nitrospirae bacterium RBG_13_39_12]